MTPGKPVCQWIVVGPDRTRDGRYIHRRCRSLATTSRTRWIDHPQGKYEQTTWFCDRHTPKGQGAAL